MFLPSMKTREKKDTIAVLDGLRALACFFVISFHINLIAVSSRLWQPYPDAGFLTTAVAYQGGSGVTLFFVLSGFLLFIPYARALLFEHSWPSARHFYLRRILRIWPAYFVALAIIVLISHPEYLQLSRFPELGLFAAFLMDSTQSTYQQINGPFWTLAVEWQYYMLLPLLALVLRWCVGQGPLRQRWWRLVACLGVMITWGVITRAFGHYYVNLHPDQTFLVPRQVLNGVLFVIYGFHGKFAEDFATGMLISCLYMLAQQQASTNTLRSLPEKTRRYSYWLWGIGVLWLLAMTIWNGNVRFHAIPWLDQLFEPYFWFSELGLSIGFGLCMVALLFGPEALRRPFEWAPLRWLGMISYSLYIWHLPLASDFALHMDRIKDILPHPLSYGMYWLYVALVIVPFSYGFYKLIERPWIRLGDRWLKRKKQDGQGQAVPGPEHEKPYTWINRKK